MSKESGSLRWMESTPGEDAMSTVETTKGFRILHELT
jgi:hypothetical protein